MATPKPVLWPHLNLSFVKHTFSLAVLDLVYTWHKHTTATTPHTPHTWSSVHCVCHTCEKLHYWHVCAAAARSLTNRLSARGQYTSACSRLPLTMACRCTPRSIHPRCSQVLLRAADGRLCARVHLSVHCGVQRAVHLVRSCSTQRSECMSTAPRFC